MAEVKEIQAEPQIQLTMSKKEAEVLAAVLYRTGSTVEEVGSLWRAVRKYNTGNYDAAAGAGQLTVYKAQK